MSHENECSPGGFEGFEGFLAFKGHKRRKEISAYPVLCKYRLEGWGVTVMLREPSVNAIYIDHDGWSLLFTSLIGLKAECCVPHA